MVTHTATHMLRMEDTAIIHTRMTLRRISGMDKRTWQDLECECYTSCAFASYPVSVLDVVL
jgi:hypothetical protein